MFLRFISLVKSIFVRRNNKVNSKCHYCENPASKTLVWLKNKRQEPAHIALPWCGCDLQTALKRFWQFPYPVVKGIDYEVE